MIIDTDPGHDDAIALILAHHFADVVGITSVAGNTTVDNATRNAIQVCDLLGVDSPVHRGAAAPLMAEPRFATEIHGADGLSGIELSEPSRHATSERATEFLLDAVDPDTWVVPIGPLTNIAQVLSRDSGWLGRIAGLSVMGGSTHGGNVTPSAEFNIYFDPEAAAQVFTSKGHILLSGLNLTHQVQISSSDLEHIKRNRPDDALTNFIDQNFSCIIERLFKLTGAPESAMHDPCAVLAVTHPELFEFIPRTMEVELNGIHTRGMTVVDERLRAVKNASHVEVGYEVDVQAAKKLILDVLYGDRST